MKTCTKCGVEKALAEFHRHSGRKDGRTERCKPCASAITAQWQKDNPERYQAQMKAQYRRRAKYDRLKGYHLSPQQYEEMLASQLGCCASCGDIFRATPQIDHDHSCCPKAARSCGECVRGLLCGDCNTMIARARDSIERLQAGAAYLSKWR